MKKILVIDDLRILPFLEEANTVKYARNSKDAIDILSAVGTWDEVWFDHDLGGSDTIIPVLAFIEASYYFPAAEPGAEIRKCVIHTSNPVGADVLMKGLGKMYFTERHFFAPGECKTL